MSLQFFYLDVFESWKPTPQILVFGKNQHNESVCLAVRNPLRTIYVVPKAGTTVPELVTRMEALRVHQFPWVKSWHLKEVKRHYCFDTHLPHGQYDLLKIQYSYAYRPLPAHLEDPLIWHLFGNETSMLENFLIKRKIMGPCWLDCQASAAVLGTWCHREFGAASAKAVKVAAFQLPRPGLSVLTLNLHTQISQNVHEITMIAGAFQESFNFEDAQAGKTTSFCWVRETAPAGQAGQLATLLQGVANVQIVASEKALLTAFLGFVQSKDPDILVGHDFYAADLQVLAQRLKGVGLPFWHKMSRLKRTGMLNPGGSFSGGQELTVGRIICDTGLVARETSSQVSYDLSSCVLQILGIQRFGLIQGQWSDALARQAAGDLRECIRILKEEARLVWTLAIRMQALSLTCELTNLCGHVWNRSLQNRRAERNEYLLMHEFHAQKYVLPDVQDKSAEKISASYEGGLVLDPKVGFYDSIVLCLDFNSLYPSIIQEYNLCFTTVPRKPPSEWKQALPEEYLKLVSLGQQPQTPGLLPTVIAKLVNLRSQVRTQLKVEKDPTKISQMGVKQLALKLVANSMYGTLGFQHSRFRCLPIAAAITHYGRAALQLVVKHVEQVCRLQIIYGDTDSVFVNTGRTNLIEAMKIGNDARVSANKLFSRLVLGVDGVYAKLLLLKKKKYAALKLQDDQKSYAMEFKGLDLVRRDWSVISKTIGYQVLEFVFAPTFEPQTVLDYLGEKAREIREYQPDKVGLDSFIITRTLSKPPKEYADAQSLPHVQVAKRLEAQNLLQAGMEIPYVICLGEAKISSLRAKHPREVCASWNTEGVFAGFLHELDLEWYVQHQVYPTVSRLLEPVEGLGQEDIREALGMASVPKPYVRLISQPIASMEGPTLWVNPSLSLEAALSQPETWRENGLSRAKLETFVVLQIKEKLAEYAQHVYRCDEPDCTIGSTQRLATKDGGRFCRAPGCQGRVSPLVTELEVLTFLRHLKKQVSAYPGMLSLVNSVLAQSAYYYVDLSACWTQLGVSLEGLLP